MEREGLTSIREAKMSVNQNLHVHHTHTHTYIYTCKRKKSSREHLLKVSTSSLV